MEGELFPVLSISPRGAHYSGQAQGVIASPDNPAAGLMTAAKRRALDFFRRISFESHGPLMIR